MIILCCGSRDWDDYDLIEKVLSSYVDEWGANNITIIHGDARGADKAAGDAAFGLGIPRERILARPANWDKYGRPAGRIRNLEMLVELQSLAISEHEAEVPNIVWEIGPDFIGSAQDHMMVVAFYKGDYSAGTQMMLDMAEAAGVFTETYRPGDV